MLGVFTGETPLIHAARQGHTDTAKYLVERGANPAIASDLGATALHHSAGIGKSFSFYFFLGVGDSKSLFLILLLSSHTEHVVGDRLLFMSILIWVSR